MDLDTYGGTDPFGMFTYFLKRTADVMASRLSEVSVNKLIGYADDSSLMVVVPSPGVRVIIAESPIRDLGRVSEWCDLCGMLLNASKTKTMLFCMSCTIHHQSPPLTIGRTVLKESDDHVILGVTFDSKVKHLREASSLGFQSSFSKTWYLQEVLASVP